MTKREFLDNLERMTGALGADERRRLLDYYQEMIEDRLEEGIPEAQAVAALGDPARIAEALAPGAAAPKGSDAEVRGLRDVRVRVQNADVTVVREALGNGAAAQLRFSDGERFAWRVEGETLVIEENAADPRRLELFGLKLALPGWLSVESPRVTLALAEDLPGGLAFSGAGFGGDATLESASGDVKLARASVAGRLEIGCKSGDVALEALRVGGGARVKSMSGDVEARGLDCGALELATASGDVEVDRGRAGATQFPTASGDVRLDELESDPELSVETASGDIALNRCIARSTRLKALAGDVEVRLEPLPCGYDLSANTRSGDIRLPRDNPKQPDAVKPAIDISTASGDISVGFVK